MLLGGGTGGGGVIKTENTSKGDEFKKGFVDGAGEGVKEIVESLNPAEIFKNLKDAAGEFIKNPVKAIFGFVKAVVTSIAHINELKDAWDAYQDEDWERLGRITGKLVVEVGGQLAGMLLGGSAVVNTIRQAAKDFAAGPKHNKSDSGDDATSGDTAAESCLHSFSGSTLVLMADGRRKPIRDIKIGDRVVATDPETGARVLRRVTRVWVHPDKLIKLVVGGEVLRTTEDHLFWSETDQRFERTDQLSRGERVLGDHDRKVEVFRVVGDGRQLRMAYNLEIEGVHTYHVGRESVLVHNDCFDLQSLSDAGRVPDRNGLTAAGRAAQKHGNRPGDFSLPESKKASSYNEFGQNMLDELLTAPNTATRRYVHRSYGPVIEYHGPSYGARFDAATGRFVGFL